MARSRRILVAVAAAVTVAAGVAAAFAIAGGSGWSGDGPSDEDVRTVQPGAPGPGARAV